MLEYLECLLLLPLTLSLYLFLKVVYEFQTPRSLLSKTSAVYPNMYMHMDIRACIYTYS